jgi:hypothetical protein
MTLDTKYTQERGTVYLTGIQALVCLAMDQMRRDRRAGLDTAAFISGYEGSPLGGYDMALMRARRLLDVHHIHFVPGVSRDQIESLSGRELVHHPTPKAVTYAIRNDAPSLRRAIEITRLIPNQTSYRIPAVRPALEGVQHRRLARRV